MRPARSGVEVGVRARPVEQPFGGEQRVQPRRHREAAAGQCDRRGEELGPGQPPVRAVHRLEQRDGAGHADRMAADDRVAEGERLPVAVEEAAGRRRRRRRLAPVVGDQALPLRVVDQHERAAADAGALRLDQVQHQLRGDRRVDRAAAAREDRVARVHRVRVRRGDHESARRDRRPVGPAGRAFGDVRRRRLRATRAPAGPRPRRATATATATTTDRTAPRMHPPGTGNGAILAERPAERRPSRIAAAGRVIGSPAFAASRSACASGTPVRGGKPAKM